MNNSEINLKIVELLKVNLVGYSMSASTAGMDKTVFDPPDYVNDPVQREPLMIELLKAGWVPYYDKDENKYIWENSNPQEEIITEWEEDEHFGISTCVAFIRMKEDENIAGKI